MKSLPILALVSLFVSGCGGGSDATATPTASACSNSYSFTAVWSINGSLAQFQRLDAKVGEPFTATVTLRDLAPAACVGLQTFSLGAGITLPRGLSLDPRTGTIQGTPTEAREIFGVSIVDVIFPGFSRGTTVLTTLSVTE